MATMLMMTAARKGHGQPAVSLSNHLFQFNGISYERAAKAFSPQRPQYTWKSGHFRAA